MNKKVNSHRKSFSGEKCVSNWKYIKMSFFPFQTNLDGAHLWSLEDGTDR